MEEQAGMTEGMLADLNSKAHDWLASNRPFLGHVATSATNQFPLPRNTPVDGQDNFCIPNEFVLIELCPNERAQDIQASNKLDLEGKEAFSFVSMKVVKFADYDAQILQSRDDLIRQWKEKNKQVGQPGYHGTLAVALSMVMLKVLSIHRITSFVLPPQGLPKSRVEQDWPMLLTAICELGPDAISPQ